MPAQLTPAVLGGRRRRTHKKGGKRVSKTAKRGGSRSHRKSHRKH